MKEIVKRLKKHAFPLAIGLTFLVLSTLCSIALPTLMAEVVDKGISEGNVAYVYKTCWVMLGVTLLNVACVIVGNKISNAVMVRFHIDLRKELFQKACGLSIKKFSSIGEGALLSRTTEDASRVADSIGSILSALTSIPFLLIAGSILAFRRDWALASIMLAFAPIVLVCIYFFTKKVHTFWAFADKKDDELNDLISSRLTGIRVVRAFNCEDREQEKSERTIDERTKVVIRANWRSELVTPLATFLLNIATIFILFVGANRLISPSSKLTAGNILAVVEYVGLISSAILMISFSLSQIPRLKVTCKRLLEILNAESEEESGRLIPSGKVRFENVCFSYGDGDKYAIEDVSFTIDEGSTVAFIGGTGAGKSTVIKLICSHFAPQKGEIYFGEQALSSLSPVEARKNVSCAMQRDTVFSGDILSSVSMGQKKSEEEVKDALKDSQILSMLEEKGEDFAVHQRGGNLSGGQKQRLTIARALLKDAPVYIFDDSFSALDFMTEKKLRQALCKRLQNKTQIIVTQRVSSAKICDKIFLFDGGKLLQEGTHDELLSTSQTYREIYLSQGGVL